MSKWEENSLKCGYFLFTEDSREKKGQPNVFCKICRILNQGKKTEEKGQNCMASGPRNKQPCPGCLLDYISCPDSRPLSGLLDYISLKLQSRTTPALPPLLPILDDYWSTRQNWKYLTTWGLLVPHQWAIHYRMTASENGLNRSSHLQKPWFQKTHRGTF